MKKILAVSLCAIMAVSAARADIASVEYVDEQITDASSAINTTINTLTQTVGTKAAQADLTSLQGTVSTLTGTVSTNKEAADKTQEDLDKLEETVAGLTTGENSVGGQIDDKISGLDVTDAAVEKQFVTSVSETDGKITVSRAALVATDIPTIEQSQVNGLTTALSGKQATISDLSTIRSGAAAGATALQKADIVTGTANGTISVDGADVAVKGLGSAAYTASGAYATSAQGAKADTALQKANIVTGTANGTISVGGADVAVKGLGSAAYTASTAYATSAQGTKADAALPKATFDGMLSTSENGENGKIPTVGFMMDSIGDAQSEIGGSISAINTALDGKQTKSTAAYQMGGANGTWTTMTEAQQAALNSTATATKINQIGTNTTNISTNAAAINAIKNASTLTKGQGDGQYALTMTKSGDTITYKWEMIGR